jgi:GAG-pre-integrase domain
MLASENHKMTVFEWHRRLAHTGLQALENLSKGSTLENVLFDEKSIQQVKNCVVCAQGKQSRNKFVQSQTRTEKVLELIYADLMGPMENESLGGKKYVLTFIDDFSRKVFVYFLAKKSECFHKFVEFKKPNRKENKDFVIRQWH